MDGEKKIAVSERDAALLSAVKNIASQGNDALVKKVRNEYQIIEIERTIKERVTFTTG